MKTKSQKRTEARKVAEAKSAQRKAQRNANGSSSMMVKPGGKGKSIVPQSKKK